LCWRFLVRFQRLMPKSLFCTRANLFN
jgi:hypothetical protein